MRALLIYLIIGVGSSYTDHALRFGDIVFWRDVVAWPVVALDRVVGLGWVLTQGAQDILSLGFAVALIAYGVGKFEAPFRRGSSDARRRPRTT